MKEFFIKLGDNPIYQRIMKEPLTYVAGAVLLSVFQIAHFALLNGGWGVTSPFATWGAWIYQGLGGSLDGWSYFASAGSQKTLAGGFFLDGGSIRNIGVIVGALMATLFASQFKVKMIKSGKQIFGAVVGGLLMGYGARMAGGCNIGALYTGTAAFSLSGWVFAAFLLVGAYIGSRILAKYLM